MLLRIYTFAGGGVLALLAIGGALWPVMGSARFTLTETIIHAVLGVCLLVAGLWLTRDMRRGIVMATAIFLLWMALKSWAWRTGTLGFYDLISWDNPIDTVIHGLLGLWGFISALRK